MTIVANSIVQAVPSVLSAGGTPQSTQGLILTNSARVPIGQVLSFPTALSVANYFGLSSTEYAAAQIYFGGFVGCTILPPALLLAQYPTQSVPAWLRSDSLATLTLDQLNALPAGTLSFTVNGTQYTSGSIELATAASFSAAAAMIQAAYNAPPFSVSFDSVTASLLITSNVAGASSSIDYAGGSLASRLNLTAATGALISQGAVVTPPGPFMSALVQVSQDWASFTHLFDPDTSGNANKYAFAAWNGTQGNNYLYIPWDDDPTAASGISSSCLMAQVKAAAISGTMALWGSDWTKAVFALGVGAAINWTQFNGRITYDFKSQSGLVPDVTDATTASTLLLNGYNFYGAYALASNGWNFLTPGSVSGPYLWADSYINQIWLNSAIELSLMTLLTTTLSIPYNQEGYALVDASVMVSVAAAVDFGAIRAGVPPSALEAAQVNNIAGVKIDTTLATRGWYLQIRPASAQTRGVRQSPPMTLFYMDGGSIHQLIIASIEVQ